VPVKPVAVASLLAGETLALKDGQTEDGTRLRLLNACDEVPGDALPLESCRKWVVGTLPDSAPE
jgi:hypothetical protein